MRRELFVNFAVNVENLLVNIAKRLDFVTHLYDADKKK